MLNSKVYLAISQIVLVLYIVAPSIVAKGVPTPSPYTRLDAIAEDLYKLESRVDSIPQRISVLEEQIKQNRVEIDKGAAWQDRFQWALILLLGESIVRLYDQFKAKRGQ